VKLAIDWKALGLDPERAVLYAPPIAGMQAEKLWKPGECIPIAPKQGWFLILDEVTRSVGGGAPSTKTAPQK
jgi:hypothetical protein